MRIVSLVPSITETLIGCQANVVGRSRFCIHPEHIVAKIPKVGGTKDVNWDKVASVKPDLVILDKEENTLEMAQTCPFPYLALHITHVDDVGNELNKLARHTENTSLSALAEQWVKVAQSPARVTGHIEALPGMLDWWRRPTTESRFEYLIWRDPWMAIGDGTFIQSVLDKLGLGQFKVRHTTKYPTIDLNRYQPGRDCLLFSSEPYPFARYKSELQSLGYACGLIDGEAYSWYGVRSLQFLQRQLRLMP